MLVSYQTLVICCCFFQITALEKENTQLKTIMAEQMDALLARVAMLEGESLAAN